MSIGFHYACLHTHFSSFFCLFSLFSFNLLSFSHHALPSTLPKTLHLHKTASSQRVCELLNWPVSQAELNKALFPSVPELPAKRELKIIEFMKKKDLRSPPFSGTRR